MAPKRDYYRYKLNDGNNVVYFGITNNPDRRESEHVSEGKNFSNMKIVGPVVKKETALNWEQERIDQYEKNHRGRKPRYNEQG